jgi:hypothetical protein
MRLVCFSITCPGRGIDECLVPKVRKTPSSSTLLKTGSHKHVFGQLATRRQSVSSFHKAVNRTSVTPRLLCLFTYITGSDPAKSHDVYCRYQPTDIKFSVSEAHSFLLLFVNFENSSFATTFGWQGLEQLLG